jgi:hypothetical protein
MRRLLFMLAIAGSVAYFAARWARLEEERAQDEAARRDWENEGGAVGG